MGPGRRESDAGCNVSIVPAVGVGPGYGGVAGGGYTGETFYFFDTEHIFLENLKCEVTSSKY